MKIGILLIALTVGEILAEDAILEAGGLGFLKGKVVETVGYRGRTPKKYHSFRNLKFASFERFKVTTFLFFFPKSLF